MGEGVGKEVGRGSWQGRHTGGRDSQRKFEGEGKGGRKSGGGDKEVGRTSEGHAEVKVGRKERSVERRGEEQRVREMMFL